MVYGIQRIMMTSILLYHQSLSSLHTFLHILTEGGGELPQEGGIEKTEKRLKIFSKILNSVSFHTTIV